ncbi:MAG TPA: cytochrome c peroxidase [Acidobacteriota bacterium]|nr:cytochrome c peroxidase [Acidobacteriota bacterium]
MRTSTPGFAIALAVLAIAPTACDQSEPPFVPEVPELPVFPEELDIDLFWVPEDNPITPEKVALGWQLFYEPRLSADETISCASCHVANAGFADPRRGSVGVDGTVGGRNAPTVINAVFSDALFWDGRAGSLEEQAVGPIMNPIEMGNTLESMEARLAEIPGYRQQFKAVFGADQITSELVGKAIATFERTVVSANSPWDRSLLSGDESLISDAVRRGNALFNDKAGCSQCHAVTNVDSVPADLYQNTGVGMNIESPDLGRYVQSEMEEDRGAFKVPMLRNVTETAPYMHDGTLATLEDVIRYYERGGDPNPWLDEKMKPLELTDQERQDLLAFLEALTGEVPAFTKRAPRLPPDVGDAP